MVISAKNGSVGIVVSIEKVSIMEADGGIYLGFDGENATITIALGESIWDLLNSVDTLNSIRLPSAEHESMSMSIEIADGFFQIWIDGTLTESVPDYRNWKIAVSNVELWLNEHEVDALIDAVDAFLSRFERKAEEEEEVLVSA